MRAFSMAFREECQDAVTCRGAVSASLWSRTASLLTISMPPCTDKTTTGDEETGTDEEHRFRTVAHVLPTGGNLKVAKDGSQNDWS